MGGEDEVDEGEEDEEEADEDVAEEEEEEKARLLHVSIDVWIAVESSVYFQALGKLDLECSFMVNHTQLLQLEVVLRSPIMLYIGLELCLLILLLSV